MLKTVLQAVGMFAVTNIDDVLILALFFGRAAGQHAGALRVEWRSGALRDASSPPVRRSRGA